jgi:hypothetical protein
VLLDETEAGDERVVPGDAVEREEEGGGPEEELDAEDLWKWCEISVSGWIEREERQARTGKAISSRMTMPAATAMAACL